MQGWERFVVFWALGYMAVYVPLFLGFLGWTVANQPGDEFFFFILMPLHFLGMASSLAALIVTFRDLYKRPFPQPNQKVTWCLLILWTGGIGWLVYLFKHGLKPRPDNDRPEALDHGRSDIR